ncbi:hypothetical protein Ancab_011003 [Ancistrocladus abbreviatus]
MSVYFQKVKFGSSLSRGSDNDSRLAIYGQLSVVEVNIADMQSFLLLPSSIADKAEIARWDACNLILAIWVERYRAVFEHVSLSINGTCAVIARLLADNTSILCTTSSVYAGRPRST